MYLNQLKENINTSLVGSVTVPDGLTILDKFTTEEVYDFVHNIAVGLPKYPDVVADTITERVLNAIPDVLQEEAIDSYIKKLLRLQLGNKATKESKALLLALLCVEFKREFPDDSITEALKEVTKFFTSHIIFNADDLQNEVQSNPTTALTQVLGNYYLRVDEEGRLVPTIQTIQNFKNYLI
jgi:hypothetical protein